MPTKTAPTGFGRPIWNAIKGGNQVHGVGLIPVSASFSLPNSTTGLWGNDGTTVVFPIFTAPKTSAAGGSWKVESATVECEANVIDNSSATNGFQAVLLTGRDDLKTNITSGNLDMKVITIPPFINTKVSGGGAVVLAKSSTAAPTGITIHGPDSATPTEVFLAPGDMLAIGMVRKGSGHDVSAMGPITITAFLRHSPPGR